MLKQRSKSAMIMVIMHDMMAYKKELMVSKYTKIDIQQYMMNRDRNRKHASLILKIVLFWIWRIVPLNVWNNLNANKIYINVCAILHIMRLETKIISTLFSLSLEIFVVYKIMHCKRADNENAIKLHIDDCLMDLIWIVSSLIVKEIEIQNKTIQINVDIDAITRVSGYSSNGDMVRKFVKNWLLRFFFRSQKLYLF